MTLWWIGDVVLLLVVLPVVVVLLNGVLTEASGHRPERPRDRGGRRRAGSKDLDAVPLLLTTQDQVIQTVENVAALRRLARRDPGRRRSLMPAAGVVLLIAVVLIVLALVYYLVSDDPRAARRSPTGLDETIAAVGEIVEKTAPVAPVVDDINANLDAAVDALEGLLVKKAGMEDAVGLVDGLYPGAAAAGFRNFPESSDDQGAAHLRGLHAGHADARPARPRGADRRRQPRRRPVLRNVTGGSLAARLLYPEERQTRPERLPRSPVIGTDSPVQYEERRCRPQRRLTTSGRRASRARSRRSSGWARTPASSPAGTACCR